MPMVSESYSDPQQILRISHNDVFVYDIPVLSGVSKFQNGFRSGPLTPEEIQGIFNNSISANTVSLLAKYEASGYEYLGRPARAFVVNDRDYSQHTWKPAQTSFCYEWEVPEYHTVGSTNMDGLIAITGLTTGTVPTWPSDSTLINIGSELFRRSVPTKAEVDLVRFAGEQKDAPALFRARNYLPRNPRQLGGAFLNYVFGVQPTISDLQRISETVVSADSVIRRYVRQEKVRLRRSGEREIWRDGDFGFQSRKVYTYPTSSFSFTFGRISGKGAYWQPATETSSRAALYAPEISWSWTARQSVRSFSTFEYFIPKPSGLMGRLSRYNQLAQRVVGGGLSPAVAYDLTPWSWLIDWFVDFGGLLHYAQTVSDNHVVATSSGFSVWEEANASVSIRGWRYDPTGVSRPVLVHSFSGGPSVATYSWRRHRRRKGNPYSIGPTWDLSQQQWAILGALGLARSSGVPVTRD